MRGFGILICAGLILALTGCFSVENNHLNPEDFAVYLKNAGVQVDNVRPLSPEPFRASRGAGILIAGSEIGVYKFDTSSRVQRERLERVRETGRFYINGIPYPVEVSGSFAVMGLDKNTQKRKIIEVLRKFE